MRPADSGSSEIAEGVAAVSVRSAAAVSEPVLSVAATSAASALFEALFSAAVESVAAVSAVFMAVDSPAEDSFDDCFISPFVWYSSAEDASAEVELPAPESEGSVFSHAERDAAINSDIDNNRNFVPGFFFIRFLILLSTRLM